MKFNYVDIENFMRFKQAYLPLTGQGLVLVLGENRDSPKASSNGAGKSSLLDAICWCLWGQTVRGLKHDEVVNEDVGKDCCVSVEFEDSGTSFRVVRYRGSTKVKKPNDLLFFVDDECDDGSSMARTQERINLALGLDFDTFRCMMPGAGIKAAELSDSVIKDLLESLLQTNVLSEAQAIAKEDLKSTKALLSAKLAELSSIESSIEDCEALIASYEEKERSFNSNKEDNVAKLESLIGKWEAKRAGIQKQVESLSVPEGAEESVSQRLREKHRAIKSTKEKFRAEREATAQQLRSVEGSVAETRAELRMLEDAKDQLLSLAGTCSKCHQEIDESVKHEHVKDYQVRIDKVTDSLCELETARQTWADSLQKNEERRKTALDKIHKDCELLKGQLDSLRDKNKQKAYLVKNLDDVDSALETYRDQLTEAKSAVSPYGDLITKELDKAQELAKQWSKVSKTKKELEKTASELDFWITGFSAKGLRSYMLKHVTPILNQQAQKYSDLLTDGDMKVSFSTSKKLKSGETREEFSIHVSHKDGASSYKGSSAGEKSRADLVISFALGDLAQRRANKRIPFRFLDEPFENIDEVGNEAVMNLLNQQKQYDTVYCITHKPLFQQLFPKTVKVIKESGESRLEEIP